MFHFYRPKYNDLHGPFKSMEEAKEFANGTCGVMIFYDHEPSRNEQIEAQAEYFDCKIGQITSTGCGN